MTTENINEVIKERLAKIEGLKAQNLNLYGERFLPILPIQEVRDKFAEKKPVKIAGRLMGIRGHGKSAFADLKDENSKIQIFFK